MKAYLINIIKVILIISVLISCSTELTPEYILTSSVQPEGSGLITPSSGEFRQGETIVLLASANEHWVFLRWEGDLTGSNPAATLTMNSDKEITAVFYKRDYPLTIEIEGEGTVTEQVVQHKTTDYPAETILRLNAEPEEGWAFSHWEGDADGTANPVQITVVEEMTIKAVFVRNNYPLTVNINGNGTVTEEVVQGKTTDYPFQTIVELTAVPEEGWIFAGWEGDLSGGENPVQIEIMEAREVTAVFEKVFYEVSVQAEGIGNIHLTLLTGNRDGDTFEYDSEIIIEAIPAAGWSFMGWSGDLSGTENPQQIVVKGNITAIANMYEVPFNGEGTTGDPYQIETLEQLDQIRNSVFKGRHFIQMNDISASETAAWNNGEGFNPIGFNDIAAFTGTYNGNGYKISGLTIDISDGVFFGNVAAGLFGFTKNATISNLTLTDVSVKALTNAAMPVGAAVGMAAEGTVINNVHATGSVNGRDYTGGLVGVIASGDVLNSTANVLVVGQNHTGGLIGNSFDTRVNASSATGNVTGNQNTGGLIGHQVSAKAVTYSYATGSVTGEINVGGLIGASFNTEQAVSVSYATGNVSGTSNTGGLIGAFSGESAVGESWASGNVTSTNGSYTGGLMGRLFAGTLIKSYATGSVSGHTSVGGLTGRIDTDGQVLESYAAGMVTGTLDTGGLSGVNQGTIAISYWDTVATGMAQPVSNGYLGTTDATGLTTLQMTGANAMTNMVDFDWGITWKPSSIYPKLMWEND